ncbi:MAG: hypothetical protein COA73_10085 [Candidatus Hydrogenedentota bacterium]|nr:MAG: hypothetical protein COA73_10085 [Candidatus Hydrogenedentota bacterium]
MKLYVYIFVIIAAILPTGESAFAQSNVLLIVTDQQTYNSINSLGNEHIQTPNLDRLVNEGMSFSNYFIAGYSCTPSRGCLLTGLYSHNHGALVNDAKLNPDVKTIGAILKKSDYSTGYMGKWHLSGHSYRNSPNRKGIPFGGSYFQKREDVHSQFKYNVVAGGSGDDLPYEGYDVWTSGWNDYHSFLKRSGYANKVKEAYDRGLILGNHVISPTGGEEKHIYSSFPEQYNVDTFLTDEAIQFIKNQNKDTNPFSLIVSLFGPHPPVAPPKPYDSMYLDIEIPLPANFIDTFEDKSPFERNSHNYVKNIWTEAQFKNYIARYWGFVTYIDTQIGRMLDTLDEEGLTEDTLVMFTTDHGDMVGAHGFIRKMYRPIFQELGQVPFIIRQPGIIPEGKSSDAMISSIDVVPTMLDLLEISSDIEFDGRSFAPLIRGETDTHRDRVFCSGGITDIIVFEKRWKYSTPWGRYGYSPYPEEVDELYDRKNDPYDLKNLAYESSHLDIVVEMQKKIESWLEEFDHPYPQTVMDRIRR